MNEGYNQWSHRGMLYLRFNAINGDTIGYEEEWNFVDGGIYKLIYNIV